MEGRLTDGVEVCDEIVDRALESARGRGIGANELDDRLPGELGTRSCAWRMGVGEPSNALADSVGEIPDPSFVFACCRGIVQRLSIRRDAETQMRRAMARRIAEAGPRQSGGIAR